MARTRIGTWVRWLTSLAALLVISDAASSWRPEPGRPRALASTAVRLVPDVFTVGRGQALPVKVCTKKPVAGERMSFTLVSSSATTTTNVTHAITQTPSDLNFAGLTGPAGLFATNVPLPAGDYGALNLVMSSVMIVQGAVTCDVDGAGPLPTRTYYTGGNPTMTVPDLFVLDPADALPVETTITTGGGGDLSFSMPVPFTIVANATTTLNVLYDTDQGFGLWDISSLTGAPDSYKIVPNDMTILAATPGP